MPRVDPTTIANRETRAKGAHAANKARREKRQRMERLAETKFEEMLDKALEQHLALLGSEDENVLTKNVREVYDRALGKALQRTEHSGSVELDVSLARDKLATKLADRHAGETGGSGAE